MGLVGRHSFGLDVCLLEEIDKQHEIGRDNANSKKPWSCGSGTISDMGNHGQEVMNEHVIHWNIEKQWIQKLITAEIFILTRKERNGEDDDKLDYL